jgi:hypothetical protein
MCLFRAFDTYVVEVLEDTQKTDVESLNIIPHSASKNNLCATHAASMSV